MTGWFGLDSGPGDAAINMALDEALLEHAARLGRPVLRFYGWTQPAATFGYFQKYAQVAAATQLRPLIRRPTGGGIVPHDHDWTYSAVFPPDHEWASVRAEESYRRIHDWLRLALDRLGVAAELAPTRRLPPAPSADLPGQCFLGHEKSDLLWHGRKIAGAAQRRNRLGLLIQGSLQPPAGPLPLARADFVAAMQAVATEKFQAIWTELAPDAELRRRTAELAAGKYSQTAYNQTKATQIDGRTPDFC